MRGGRKHGQTIDTNGWEVAPKKCAATAAATHVPSSWFRDRVCVYIRIKRAVSATRRTVHSREPLSPSPPSL